MEQLDSMGIKYAKSWNKTKLLEALKTAKTVELVVADGGNSSKRQQSYRVLANLKTLRQIHIVKKEGWHLKTQFELEQIALERARKESEDGIIQKSEVNKKASGYLWYMNSLIHDTRESNLLDSRNYFEAEMELSDLGESSSADDLLLNQARAIN